LFLTDVTLKIINTLTDVRLKIILQYHFVSQQVETCVAVCKLFNLFKYDYNNSWKYWIRKSIYAQSLCTLLKSCGYRVIHFTEPVDDWINFNGEKFAYNIRKDIIIRKDGVLPFK
jgi:hypothetical protein